MRKSSKKLSADSKPLHLPDELLDYPAIDNAESKIHEAYINHLSFVVESTEDTIISKSLDGTIQSWNKGSEKMFG